MESQDFNRPGLGIAFVCVAILAISINDMLIKFLSDGYPLHEIVAFRAGIGLLFSLIFVHFEGGWRILRTKTPGLHMLRGLLVVTANLAFYAAVAVIPLAEATALFFVAPLFITVLSIPLLGEQVGPFRMAAVFVGFLGVVLMQRPWAGLEPEVSRIVLLLPVLAALTYALMQVMTRKLGVTTQASAMAVYIQGLFLVVSMGFFLVAGDGRFAEHTDSPSLQFLFRAWTWPKTSDYPVLLALGVCSGIVGYCLSAAYRVANAATVAPFEYLGLPLAIVWGWLLFAEWPAPVVWAGCALIVGAGLIVFLREQQRARPIGWRQRAIRR
ncbi:MAG: DMT family transporter [Rhodobacteraceae bacterium]|nr:DMT family transporter [Paracoccaceae bacterium]